MPLVTATLRLRLGFNGERPKEKPSLDRKVEVAACFNGERPKEVEVGYPPAYDSWRSA